MDVPDEYKDQIGTVTAAKTGPQLQRFVQDGGTIVAIGSSASFNNYFGLPVTNGLTETTAEGTTRPLTTTQFYVPGLILQASVDTRQPVAWGLANRLDVFFATSPAFRLQPDAALKGTRPVAWYDGPQPLRSGWAWGQGYLNGTVAAGEANVGKGEIYLFGPEITFRAQPQQRFCLTRSTFPARRRYN
jgi:hypothetical protein